MLLQKMFLVDKNLKMLEKVKRWDTLLIIKELIIKEKCPMLNSDLKAFTRLKLLVFSLNWNML